jgi:diadenosine tetraphosphate (Ap4A) HIT family hydrolase
MPCIFCAIVADEAPRSVVFEDDLVLGLMDIRPITPGHLLVIPKDHATHLADLPSATGGHMMEVAMELATAIRRSDLRRDGINLFLADGEVAGQEIFHVHVHVVPRFPGDGFGLDLRYDPAPDRSTLDGHASMIRTAR